MANNADNESLFEKTTDFLKEKASDAWDFISGNDEEVTSQENTSVVSRPISRPDYNAEKRVDFSKSKLNIKRHKYPQELDQDIQPHSVVFRIKTREQSRMGQTLANSEGTGGFTELGNDQNRLSADQTDNLFGVYGAAVTLGGAVAGAKLGKSLATKTLGATVGAAGAGFAADFALQQNRLSRTIAEIQLYVPQSPQAKYSAQWQEAELGAITGLLSQLDVNGGIDGLVNSISNSGAGAAELLGRGLVGTANIFKAVGLNVDFRGAVQAATKKVENPFKEQLFKSMGFRDFAFEYKFAPKNNKELSEVMAILQLFKIHMHPDKDDTGLFLIYPSEFEIEFRYKGQQNKFIHRLSNCALTDVRIDYGQGGTLTTFKDTEGAPSEITMQMAFKELEVLTRDRIEQGY